jgi:hypothetical protein
MLRLMATIRASAPQARFILWTNGTNLLWTVTHKQEFAYIVQSDYLKDSSGEGLDGRLDLPIGPDSNRACVRPFTELIFDAHGNQHPCCMDWQGGASVGNLEIDPFGQLVRRWRFFQEQTAGLRMAAEAPARCRQCNSEYRLQWNEAIPSLAPDAQQRAIDWRNSL